MSRGGWERERRGGGRGAGAGQLLATAGGTFADGADRREGELGGELARADGGALPLRSVVGAPAAFIDVNKKKLLS